MSEELSTGYFSDELSTGYFSDELLTGHFKIKKSSSWLANQELCLNQLPPKAF